MTLDEIEAFLTSDTPDEQVILGLKIEELERPKAVARQAEGQHLGGEVFAGREASGSREPEASRAHDFLHPPGDER